MGHNLNGRPIICYVLDNTFADEVDNYSDNYLQLFFILKSVRHTLMPPSGDADEELNMTAAKNGYCIDFGDWQKLIKLFHGNILYSLMAAFREYYNLLYVCTAQKIEKG